MKIGDLFIKIMTDKECYFKDIRCWQATNIGMGFANVLSIFWMLIGKGLAGFLAAMEDFANKTYSFLSFSKSEAFTSLYKLINDYIVIPIAICLIIIALKYVIGDMGRGDSKRFLKNMGIVMFMLIVMPSVFNFLNTNIYTNMTASQNTKSGIADHILRRNTTDFWYLYQESKTLKDTFSNNSPTEGEKEVDDSVFTKIKGELSTLKKNYNSSDYSDKVTFDNWTFDPNVTLEENNGYSESKFFRYKVSLSDKEAKVIKLYDGVYIPIVNAQTDINKETYIRYKVDYINTFIQLIATALLYFCVAYSIIKLIVELLTHQLFGPVMAALDLTGGERMKRYLSSIVGIYIALLLSSVVVMLYNYALDFVSTNLKADEGWMMSLFTVTLALTMMDIPNIVARYFNVNTGIRGGMFLAGAGFSMASRGARAVAHTASRTVRGVGRGISKAGRTGLQLTRKSEISKKQSGGSCCGSAQNAKEAQFKGKHGTDGNFEKYQKPIDYNPNNKGSQKNTDAVMQRAAAARSFGEFSGAKNANDFQSNIAGGGKALGLDQKDTDITKAMSSNSAAVRDAQRGMYTGIATEAVKNGGTNQAYRDAAQKSAQAIGVGAENEGYVGYLADASFNAHHANQIRAEAKNIKQNNKGISDVDAYVSAMKTVGGTYHFNEDNIEKIAQSELKNFGSLSNGNIYDSRPSSPEKYKVSAKSALH